MPTDKDKITRKLKAILSVDVKGYSLLMTDDEAYTIRTLKEHRQIMSHHIKQHSGRVVDAPGDNILAEFGSAVDAVQCSVEIQKALKEKNEDLPLNKRLEFRILRLRSCILKRSVNWRQCDGLEIFTDKIKPG